MGNTVPGLFSISSPKLYPSAKVYAPQLIDHLGLFLALRDGCFRFCVIHPLDVARGDLRRLTITVAMSLLVNIGYHIRSGALGRHAYLCFALALAFSMNLFSQTPLFEAIRNNDFSRVLFQLNHGADPNGRDLTGSSPLMYAALYSDPGSLKLLLDRGADPNIANGAGSTPLMWAAGNPRKIRILLEHDAQVNAVANSGRTPLIIASSFRGNVESVRVLLKAGANVRARDSDGFGPVLAASQITDTAILSELLAHGGDANEESTRLGQSALMNAAGYGSLEAVNTLLSAGADVNRQSKEPPQIKVGLQERGRMTASLWAAPFANREVIASLLKNGADPNVPEYRGMNSLILASTSETQNLTLIRLLLSGTADVNRQDKSGLTALDWARRVGNSSVARILEGAGMESFDPPKRTLQTPEGQSSIRSAVEKSISLIQVSSDIFFRKTGCLSCHHTMLGGLLVGVAKSRGLNVDDNAAILQLKEIAAIRMPEREAILQQQHQGGFPMTSSLLLMSLYAQGYPANSLTDALALQVLAAQQKNGSWSGFDQRPPSEYSAFSETAYAIRAIQSYTPPGRRREAQAKVKHAACWLLSEKPRATEEEVMQLLGLGWSNIPRSRLRKLALKLMSQQKDDGGWAQRDGFSSDAYATGEVLYALNQAAQVPISSRAYQKGVRYLLNSQFSDGSWYVKSRSVPFQPYFESGFPHGHDQWISAAATCWAGTALALTFHSGLN